MIMKQEKIGKPLHETFLQIVTEFGEKILNENRLLGLLSDLGGHEFSQYKFVVKCLLEKNLGNQILNMKDLDDSDRMLRIANLQQLIVEEYSLQEEKVKYIIDCYLFSLGLIESVNAEDRDMLENVESNDTESASGKMSFKPDPFIFEELLTLFRKHSKITAGNGIVSKRKEISDLKINVTTFTQAVEAKYGVTLDTPSFSSFLTVENLIDYIIEKHELKSVEYQTELTTDRGQENSWDKKTLQNPVSYIKIEDSSLTSLPVFAEILDIIRTIGYFDINEYTEASEYSCYNWYEKLPEKIQLFYGVRPELPSKERFEYIGDLIKYIIHRYEIREKKKLEPLPLWGKIIYVFPAPILISILGKLWLEGKAKYDQIMLGLENTNWLQWGKKMDIRDAADSEVAWIYILASVFCVGLSMYYKNFLKDDIDFENSIAGYLVKFVLMMLLVSVLMQWWPCLVVAILEIVLRYYKLNKTGGHCIRTFMNKR